MAESYIPEDTNVICTLQTIPSPLMIKQYRNQAFTIHDAKTKPLLNVVDKKISAAFECVNVGSFWGGLMTLCLGIAVGALIAAATVLTGGLALVALGVALVACGIGIGAGVVALCKIPHACDATLSSPWLLFHMNVTIEGQNALLNKSYIQCTNGGLVNLIMDPAIAQAAAQKIGDHNMNYFYIHLGENFLQGLLSTVSCFTGGSKAEIITSPAVSVISYSIFEYEGINDHESPASATDVAIDETLESVIEDAASDVAKTIGRDNGGSFTRGLLLYIYGAGHHTAGRAMGSTSDELLGACINGVGKNRMKSNAVEFFVGLAVSVGMGIWKNSEHTKARNANESADDEDSQNGISVVAIDAN